jgi:hypothetical protein
MTRRRREPERERPGPQRYDCGRKGQEEEESQRERERPGPQRYDCGRKGLEEEESQRERDLAPRDMTDRK